MVTAARSLGPRPGDPGRRLVAMAVVVGLAAALMVGRLAQVQAFSSGPLAALSAAQTVRSVPLPGARGAIFDRNGHDLALSVNQATIWADPRLVADPDATAAALAPVIGVDVDVLRRRLGQEAAFVYLARQVDDAVAEAVRQLDVDGVFFLDEARRFNPAGSLAAPVLGQVGIDNTGLSGLELVFDRTLTGEPGELVVERAPDGVVIPAGMHRLTPPSPGDDLILTLDRALQFEAERLLAAQIVKSNADGGVVVVTDPRTGEILAMANLEAAPEEASVAGVRGVQPSHKNKAVTDIFEPGSVNKVITVAAALEERLFERYDELQVPDNLRVADHTFTDHDDHATAMWSLNEILVRSSNVGTIMLGQGLGKERIDRYLRAFGFGSETGLDFPGESAGLMLPVDQWSGTTIGTVPIGQGVSVTALQMLEAYNVIANEGRWVPPRLVRATVDRQGKEHAVPAGDSRAVVSEGTARAVTGMLADVVRTGTGVNAAVEGYTVAGKTGTARKPKEGARGYAAGKYVASFAGFVPAEDPRLSIIVMLDEPFPIYGGAVAAPVFSHLAAYALRHLRIPPPPAPPPAAPPDTLVLDAEANDARVRGEAAPIPTTTVVPGSTAARPDGG